MSATTSATTNNDASQAASNHSGSNDDSPAKRTCLERARFPAKFKEGDLALTQPVYNDRNHEGQGIPVQITKVEYDEDQGEWYYVGDMKGLNGHTFAIHCSEDSLTKPELAIGERVEKAEAADDWGTVMGYYWGDDNTIEYRVLWDDWTWKREELRKEGE